MWRHTAPDQRRPWQHPLDCCWDIEHPAADELGSFGRLFDQRVPLHLPLLLPRCLLLCCWKMAGAEEAEGQEALPPLNVVAAVTPQAKLLWTAAAGLAAAEAAAVVVQGVRSC